VLSENLILLIFGLLPLVAGGAVWLYFAHFQQHRVPSKRNLRLIAGNFLVLLFLLSLIFPIGEVYYRFFYDTTDAYGMTRVNQDWLKRYYHLNNVHLRDSVDYSAKIRPGTHRLTFIGDSFTAGHGVKNVEQRFVNRIRKSLGDWDVQCHAINGLDSLYQIRHIEKIIEAGYEFGLTVLVYVPNDIMQTLPPLEHPVEKVRAAADPPWLAKHSYLLNTWYYRQFMAKHKATAEYYSFLPQHYQGRYWDFQQGVLGMMQNLIEENHGRLIVVTFPFLHELGPDSRFRGVHQKLNALWQQRNVPHLDLLPLFESHAAENLIVSRRDPHPNEHAHELAAKAIIDFIHEHEEISPRSREEHKE
jgi:hypothetical protein